MLAKREDGQQRNTDLARLTHLQLTWKAPWSTEKKGVSAEYRPTHTRGFHQSKPAAHEVQLAVSLTLDQTSLS
jgi:hypothetical protein